MGDESLDWELPITIIESYFTSVQNYFKKQTPPINFSWSEAVVSEIKPNVERTLNCKFQACKEGYSAAKVAALYTFWVSKLKPGFGLEKAPLYVNEYLALKVGFALIHERLNITIKLSQDEMLNICDTLRYHTSSPYMLMNIYAAWIDREYLRKCLRIHKIDPKDCKKAS